jgi:hypothetical protein
MTITEREFWARVDCSGGETACWTWTGATRVGYGAVRWQGRVVGTHRLAWTLIHGPIDDGLHVLHHCDNPPCCNPAHLFLGTNRENIADRAAKGRPGRGGVSGERNARARLNPSAVEEIRQRYEAGGVLQRQLAAEFGVSKGAVKHVLARRTWRNV